MFGCFIAVLGTFRQLKHWQCGVCVRASSSVHRRLENLQRNHHLQKWAPREGVLHGSCHNRRGLGVNECFIYKILSRAMKYKNINFFKSKSNWRNFLKISPSRNECGEIGPTQAPAGFFAEILLRRNSVCVLPFYRQGFNKPG